MKQFGIGQPVRRVEDRRFLTGRGRYLDDIVRPRQAYAAMLRSPHAHARIRSIDTSTASAVPGVLAVLTGEDLAHDGIGTIPCMTGLVNRDQSSIAMPPYPALARDRVRHVGDTVAMVVAETPAAARDAAEQIAVDYEPLRAVVDAAQALEPGRPAVWDQHPGNLCFDWETGSHRADPAQQSRRGQFDGATRRDRRIRSGRGQLHPMELDPRFAFLAQPARRACLSCAGKPHPGSHPRCWRRLRHEAVPLSRACAGAVGGEAARPAGQMDPRPLRCLHDRHPGPRQSHPARSHAR